MKILRCEDLGMAGGDGFTATGNSDRAVIEEMKHHMRLEHPHLLQDFPEDELDKILGAKITEEGDQDNIV